MKLLISFAVLFSSTVCLAQAGESSWTLRPSFTVGYNQVQKSYYSVGLSLQSWATENVLWGAGGYFSSGSDGNQSREIGAGPFVAFFLPVSEELTFQLRQEVNYIDQHQPVPDDNDPTTPDNDFTTENGVVSVTSLGAHLKIIEHFGMSGGYRLVVAISNDKLDDDRSGPFLGIAISF